MSQPADLTYRRSCSLFTMFLPETNAGEVAWRELAAQTDGTGKVLHQQVELTIEALRKAGYSVAKHAETPAAFDDIMLAELDEVLADTGN